MAGFGLAEEHQNCLLTAAPSKVVAGGGRLAPYRYLPILQSQDLNLTTSDEGVTTPEASIMINLIVLMTIIR